MNFGDATAKIMGYLGIIKFIITLITGYIN